MTDFNFENDLRKELKGISSSLGFKITEHKNLDKMLMDYLTVRTKIIEPKQRRILINPIFKREIQTHPKRKEIEYIIQAASQGKYLNSFQSKKLLQANFHDHLQIEWNIFHFESAQIVFLGTDIHNDGFFADTKWIEILHNFFRISFHNIKMIRSPRFTQKSTPNKDKHSGIKDIL